MTAARQPAIVRPAGATWVLVKGWHDSGKVEGVYGPYTEDRARWMLDNLLELATGNWTLAELQREPE